MISLDLLLLGHEQCGGTPIDAMIQGICWSECPCVRESTNEDEKLEDTVSHCVHGIRGFYFLYLTTNVIFVEDSPFCNIRLQEWIFSDTPGG